MTDLDRALLHIKNRADAWAVKEVDKALSQKYWIDKDNKLYKMPDDIPQKSGKWIAHDKPHGIRYLECPYCNIWYLNEHLIRNSYCPNCGAKMEDG